MPAKSKKQQKFMGMVHAVQKGKMKAPSKEVAKVAKEIKPSEAKKFAKTKQEGLPEKKSKKKVNESMDKKEQVINFINSVCNRDYTPAKESLQNIINLTIKERISRTISEKKSVKNKDNKKGKNFNKVEAKTSEKNDSE